MHSRIIPVSKELAEKLADNKTVQARFVPAGKWNFMIPENGNYLWLFLASGIIIFLAVAISLISKDRKSLKFTAICGIVFLFLFVP